MKKKLLAYCITALFSVASYGQADVDQLFIRADSAYFDYKDYQLALDLYTQISDNITKKNDNYAYTIDKIARAYFFLQMEARDNNDVEKAMKWSTIFIDYADKHPKQITQEILDKKYFMYKNMVTGYFSLGQKDKAKPYQNKLYAAYKKKELPDGIDLFYNFEKFVFEGQNIWGYEWYPVLGDPETEGSFHKHVYYVYSTDEDGKDKDQLYTLHTVKVHKIDPKQPDYVLTRIEYLDDKEKSETIWSLTFEAPVDYDKLHNAVVEYLKGNVESDTESEFNYKTNSSTIKIK